MRILMAGVSPHPPLIIPEIGGEQRKEIQQTIDSLTELGEEIKETNPELIITISPHGPVFKDAISTFALTELKGDFGEFGHPEVAFKVKSNPEFVGKLAENSKNENINLIDLSSTQPGGYGSLGRIDSELDHGVLIPLYFLNKAGVKTPLVALTMGLMDYQELYNFGTIMQKTLEEMKINAVIIASADLSHRLIPEAPAGYNPHGKEFDKKYVDFLNEKKFEEMLALDESLIKKAGECGFRPTIILLGALKGLKVETEVKSYEGPFGVGYAVVGFYPEEE